MKRPFNPLISTKLPCVTLILFPVVLRALLDSHESSVFLAALWSGLFYQCWSSYVGVPRPTGNMDSELGNWVPSRVLLWLNNSGASQISFPSTVPKRHKTTSLELGARRPRRTLGQIRVGCRDNWSEVNGPPLGLATPWACACPAHCGAHWLCSAFWLQGPPLLSTVPGPVLGDKLLHGLLPWPFSLPLPRTTTSTEPWLFGSHVARQDCWSEQSGSGELTRHLSFSFLPDSKHIQNLAQVGSKTYCKS